MTVCISIGWFICVLIGILINCAFFVLLFVFFVLFFVGLGWVVRQLPPHRVENGGSSNISMVSAVVLSSP
jgi:flagellar biogenesis protein FliO